MKRLSFEKRIAELEQEVRELKARPAVQHHYHYQTVPYYQPVPYYIPAPQPWPGHPWTVLCGSTTGSANTSVTGQAVSGTSYKLIT